MSRVIFILFSTFLLLFIQSSESFDCKDVLFEESEGLLNYLATVKFKTPVPLNDEQWVLELKTDNEFTFLGGWKVWVISRPADGKATFKSRDENITIPQGEKLSFRFRIQWYLDEPRPQVVSMIWQGHQLCNNDDNRGIQPIAAYRIRRTYNEQAPIKPRVGRRRMRFPVN